MLFIELAQQPGGALNGPRHQLGEEGDEHHVAQQIPLHLHVPPVHVDGVAEGLEDVEGDTHRQQQIQLGHPEGYAGAGQKGIEIFYGKIGIFEEEQQGQVQHQRNGHNALAAGSGRVVLLLLRRAVQGNSAEPGDKGGGKQQQRILGIPAHVEIIAAHQKPDVANFMGNQEINQGNNREENQKVYRIKQHSASPLHNRFRIWDSSGREGMPPALLGIVRM